MLDLSKAHRATFATIFTTAPQSYDWGGWTVEMMSDGKTGFGVPLRTVLIDTTMLQAQVDRYRSGLYIVATDRQDATQQMEMRFS